jgi:hypothetical protein
MVSAAISSFPTLVEYSLAIAVFQSHPELLEPPLETCFFVPICLIKARDVNYYPCLPKRPGIQVFFTLC